MEIVVRILHCYVHVHHVLTVEAFDHASHAPQLNKGKGFATILLLVPGLLTWITTTTFTSRYGSSKFWLPNNYQQVVMLFSLSIFCSGDEETTFVQWMQLKNGPPQRCECGHWFKLIQGNPTKIQH